MRQIDHVHDSKHKRQARRHQKQHDAQLKSVERLFKEKIKSHMNKNGGTLI